MTSGQMPQQHSQASMLMVLSRQIPVIARQNISTDAFCLEMGQRECQQVFERCEILKMKT